MGIPVSFVGPASGRSMSTTRRWKITLAVILIGGLLITHGLWSFLIGPMDQVIDNIMVFNNK